MGKGKGDYPRKPRRARVREPLTPGSLEELALAYVARFATTARGLERYCQRKLRDRGWHDDAGEADVSGLVARFVASRYVSDREFARARTRGLLARGYGDRRVRATLAAAGVDDGDRPAVTESDARHAALRLAVKRGFGPFGAAGPPQDRIRREKQFAAMLRAGHSLDIARELVDAPDEAAARAWASACDEEEIR